MHVCVGCRRIYRSPQSCGRRAYACQFYICLRGVVAWPYLSAEKFLFFASFGNHPTHPLRWCVCSSRRARTDRLSQCPASRRRLWQRPETSPAYWHSTKSPMVQRKHTQRVNRPPHHRPKSSSTNAQRVPGGEAKSKANNQRPRQPPPTDSWTTSYC